MGLSYFRPSTVKSKKYAHQDTLITQLFWKLVHLLTNCESKTKRGKVKNFGQAIPQGNDCLTCLTFKPVRHENTSALKPSKTAGKPD